VVDIALAVVVDVVDDDANYLVYSIAVVALIVISGISVTIWLLLFLRMFLFLLLLPSIYFMLLLI
jgi:hypothetical protein